MTSINWRTGISGDWTLASNWSGNAVPTPASNVVISAAPAIPTTPYAVSLASAQQINALTLSQKVATLELDGTTLTVATAMSLAAGTLSLMDSTLSGLSAQNLLAVSAGAASSVSLGLASGFSQTDTLSNLIWRGTLNLVNPSDQFQGQSLSLSNVAFTGAGGAGAGRINIGQNVALYLDGAGLANATASLADGAALAVTAGGPMTIAATAAVTAASGSASLDAEALTNAGRITVSNGATLSTGGPFDDTLQSFTNSGTVSVSGGGTFFILSTAVTNTGLIAVGAGGYAFLGGDNPATLSNSGSFTVAATGTLSIDAALTTAQLASFGVTAGTLGIAGPLDNTGAVLSAGSGAGAAAANLLLDGGTITGGTLVTSGCNVGTSGTLSDVTVKGAIVLDNAALAADGATVFTGTASGQGATLTLMNASGLTFQRSQTLDQALIAIGGNSGIFVSSTTGAPARLTLGASTHVTVTGGQATLSGSATTAAIVNRGAITATVAGSVLRCDGLINTGHITIANGATLTGMQTNAGTISAGAGGSAITNYTFGGATLNNAGLITEATAGATLSLAGSLNNTGTIAASNGATLVLNAGSTGSDGTTLTNTGTISVADGVLVANSITLDELDSIRLTRSSVQIIGDLNNPGNASLLVGTGTALGSVKLAGGISNSTVVDSGNGLVFYGANFLDNVTYDGALNITRPLTTLTMLDGSSVTSNTGTGLINLTGAGAALIWSNTGALDNATLAIGSSTLSIASHPVEAPVFASGTGSTQLGAHLTIRHAATYATLGGVLSGGYASAIGTITSAATIQAGIGGGQLSLEGASFTSTGVIAVSNTDTVIEGATAFTNAGAITVGAASTFAIDTYNYFASATFADTSFINSGSIALSGGTLSELTGGDAFQAVPILNNGTIRGAGLLNSQADNAGAIIATGGTLTLDQAISGTGSLVVGTGATLNLTSSVAAGQRVTFGGASGVLGLAPATFHAKLAHFTAGDAIDLAKTAATAAAFSGNAIIVTLSSGGTISLGTTSALSGNLATTSDGHGGTLVEFAGSHVALAPEQSPVFAAPATDPAWAHIHLPDAVQSAWSGSGHVHMQQA